MSRTGLIFDCDGTLINSESLHYESWQDTLRNYGKNLTLEIYHSLVGLSNESMAELFAKELKRDMACLSEKKKNLFEQKIAKQPIARLEDAATFIQKLIVKKSL
jgi:putative hydrolase of the HAD superfamily